jgi:hypothetical protein
LFEEIGDEQIDNFLQNRFDTQPGNFIEIVPTWLRDVGNSAAFQAFDEQGLGDNPTFDMGVERLCGCTVVFIVSQRAVWSAHIV